MLRHLLRPSRSLLRNGSAAWKTTSATGNNNQISIINPNGQNTKQLHQNNATSSLVVSTDNDNSSSKHKSIPFIYEELSNVRSPKSTKILPEKRLTSNIALFLDLDNVLIGEIFPNFGRDNRKLQLTIIDSILKACKGRGRVVVKWAYGDAIRYKSLRPDFHERAVDMKDTPPHQRAAAAADGGKSWVVPPKNSADIKMVVDAMELAYTNDSIDTYVLASGDSDFTPILSKLRELGKHTIVISLPERLSWRLEEYSDETLSLTELFRNRVIDKSEYMKALRAIYAAYELQTKFSHHGPVIECYNGGLPYLPVSLVKQSMEFLATQYDASNTSSDSSDLEWTLNTRHATKYIKFIRGPKGKKYIRPRKFDPSYDSVGPSDATPGGLTRKDRFKILQSRLQAQHINIKLPSLRHESASFALESLTSLESKEGECVKCGITELKNGQLKLRAAVIQHVAVMTSYYMSTNNLPKFPNQHVRHIVDIAIAAKVFRVARFNEHENEASDDVKEEDALCTFKLAPNIETYDDIRETIDKYIMSTVLYELDSNTIKPDTTEWYSLLYNEDVINSNDGSENDKNDIVMEDHEIEYIKAVEKKVMEEYVKGLNKDDIVDKKDEQRPGFFARLFG